LKIALTRTENPEKHQFYVDWLTAASGVEVITLSAADHNVDELSRCNGLVLSGGIDIHPQFYGGQQLDYPGAPAHFDPARDRMEMAAFQIATEQRLPVLGICRGLQLINVICKGTLVQDLGQEPPESQHLGNPDSFHLVHVERGTLLHDLVGSDEERINSAHHQAVSKLGEGLMVNCRAEDGLIEGIEWLHKKDKPFMLAVQWHPERMFRFQLENAPMSRKIQERFIEEINNSNH
jgi:putative glutamine amidotransferase